jgi:hypothetical protein
MKMIFIFAKYYAKIEFFLIIFLINNNYSEENLAKQQEENKFEKPNNFYK